MITLKCSFYNFCNENLKQVGAWSFEDGFTETRVIIPPVEQEGSEFMKGKHFIILTALVGKILSHLQVK